MDTLTSVPVVSDANRLVRLTPHLSVFEMMTDVARDGVELLTRTRPGPGSETLTPVSHWNGNPNTAVCVAASAVDAMISMWNATFLTRFSSPPKLSTEPVSVVDALSVVEDVVVDPLGTIGAVSGPLANVAPPWLIATVCECGFGLIVVEAETPDVPCWCALT